jgi:hypothetical protein
LTKDLKHNPPPPTDKRGSPRKRTLLSGVITMEKGNISFRCGIKDISSRGARIIITEGQRLPSEIYLINLRDGTAHRAEVKWIREATAGLHILTSIDLSTATDRGVEFLKRIWRNHATPTSGMPQS